MAFLATPNVFCARGQNISRLKCAPRNGGQRKALQQPTAIAGAPRTTRTHVFNEGNAVTTELIRGAHCPIIDRGMLRHCLRCTQQIIRNQERKDAQVQRLLSQARLALRVTNRGQAEKLYLRAIVVDPKFSRSYFLYALQVQRRDPNLARELFHQGVRANPTDAKLLQAWGLFESKQGKLERAKRLLHRSVSLEPRLAPVLRWKRIFATAK